jgi:hypothetical protein
MIFPSSSIAFLESIESAEPALVAERRFAYSKALD